VPLVYLLIVVMALAITFFALQNADRVTISFLIWRVEGAPLAAVILISGAVGALVVSLVGVVQRWKLRGRIRQLESQLRAAEPTAARTQHGTVEPPERNR
jgi:uncharacterized integral membrane protein